MRNPLRRRILLGITQSALAAKIGVGGATLCRWEKGDREPMPLYRKKWLAVLLRLERNKARREAK